MNSLINKLFSLSAVWRYSILLMLGVLCAHLIYQNLLLAQKVVIKQNENKLLQLNNKINQYSHDRKNMLEKEQVFNKLDQQLIAFEKALARFKNAAPERDILDAVVESTIKTDEINISKREQDEFGYFYLVNISVTGDRQKVGEFFSLLLNRRELVVWEQMEFQHSENLLSLSITSRYYFEIFGDVYE